MSETACIKNLVLLVLEMVQQRGAKSVLQVQITLSRAIAASLSETSLQETFRLLTLDTPAQDARLVIAMEAPQYKCLACSKRFKTLVIRQGANCPACHSTATEANMLNSIPYALNTVSFL